MACGSDGGSHDGGGERWTKTTMGCLCPKRRNKKKEKKGKVGEKSRWPEKVGWQEVSCRCLA